MSTICTLLIHSSTVQQFTCPIIYPIHLDDDSDTEKDSSSKKSNSCVVVWEVSCTNKSTPRQCTHIIDSVL